MFPYCKHQLLTPPECFGLRLRPFSLGHIDLLTALESPVADGESMNRADLAIAVWICSKTNHEAIHLYRTGKAAADLKMMGRIGEKYGDVWIGRQLGIFKDYLDTYFMTPPRWDPKSPVTPNIPWHLSVFCALQRDLSYTPDELLNMPLPRALELFAAVCSNRGDDTLLTLNEQKITDLMEGGGQ